MSTFLNRTRIIYAAIAVIVIAVGGSIVASLWLTRGCGRTDRQSAPRLRREREET